MKEAISSQKIQWNLGHIPTNNVITLLRPMISPQFKYENQNINPNEKQRNFGFRDNITTVHI